VRRTLLEEASRHHLLLHTGQLEALTCPATIVHRWRDCWEGQQGEERYECPPACLPALSPWPDLLPPRPAPGSLRDDVVPLALVQRLADELARSSRAFHLELLPVRRLGGRVAAGWWWWLGSQSVSQSGRQAGTSAE
jgi:hypothetical protein